MIAAAAAAGAARADIPPAELAAFCADALTGTALPPPRAVELALSALRADQDLHPVPGYGLTVGDGTTFPSSRSPR